MWRAIIVMMMSSEKYEQAHAVGDSVYYLLAAVLSNLSFAPSNGMELLTII